MSKSENPAVPHTAVVATEPIYNYLQVCRRIRDCYITKYSSLSGHLYL